MERKTRTWLSIALAVLLVLAVVGIAAVGGVAYFVYSRVHSEDATDAVARDRFTQLRQKFDGRRALVELPEGGEPVVHRPDVPLEAPRRPLETMRVLVYDAREERITEFSIPFWLIRLAPSGDFSFRHHDLDIDTDALHLTVADLERHGPGLIVDHEDRRGARAIVWTE